ncbi:MAG: glycerol kinase GlpK [Ruminococcaceae bacterium]|nr:glycerol kinase GlpK [Oscillospiraceae bacterium]
MKKYILALDSGTTSVRAMLFDKKGDIRAVAQHEFTQIFPKAGWVEHDAEEIWRMQLLSVREAMDNCRANASEIAAIGITNQRETAIVWEKSTGKPVYNAIVWQCRRTAEFCDSLKEAGYTELIRERTGLVPDAYFSGAKIRWILDNVEGLRERAEAGELLFGTVDSWLIWNLTGGVHVTDVSNASRTMLFNINTLSWDEELCRIVGVPMCMLPEVKPSSSIYGMSDPALFGGEIPVSGAAGDQQAALFGQCCFEKGDVKNTYGTGCFMLMNTGDSPILSKSGLVSTVGWSLKKGQATYALEGSVFVAGAVIQWLRDEVKLISSSAESETVARSVPDTNGCYFVPAFTGMGAPYWDQDARGTIAGLTRGTKRAHIVRAALEAMAYQSTDVLRAMEEDAGELSSLRVDGGASANNFLMQFQADAAGVKVVRPSSVETTALGAAFLAGLAVGFWKDKEELLSLAMGSGKREFVPEITEEQRRELIGGWHKAVSRALL